jgi:hypothetical protein
MTEALITTEPFMGLEIRIVHDNPDRPAIPLHDIARATGYDPDNLNRLFKRNRELLNENARNVKFASGDQVAPVSNICLDREGVMGILMKLDYVRIKDQERKDKILAFQRWAKTTLSEMQIQSKIVKDHGDEWSSIAIEHLKFAGFLSHHPNVDPGLSLAIGIREAEKATGRDLSPYKKLIPPAGESFGDYVTVTQIAMSIDMRAHEVNRYLERMGFQYRDGSGEYFLTQKGCEYGRVFPLAASSGHTGYFLKWRRSIITASRMRENRPCRIRE